LGDLFGGGIGGRRAQDTRQDKPQEAEKSTLDVIKTIEVPIFDLILGTKLHIETVYSKHLTLTVPQGTKSGTKFRVK
jgi:DnaJ-class molecular chaperone